MSNCWLLKTEPNEYGCADLERDGKTTWNEVRNPLALKHIRFMKKGDQVFIYHTGDEKQIVGIAEITSEPYPDPKKNDPKLAVVDLIPIKKLTRPVQLAQVKARKEFSKFELVRMPRLSVMPVPRDLWDKILGIVVES